MTVTTLERASRSPASTEPAGARRYVFVLALAAGVEVVVAAGTLHLLVGWPPRLLEITAVAAVPALVAVVIRPSRRLEATATRLVAPAVSVAGLTLLVACVYLVVVLGLGRPPTRGERSVFALSMLAAAVSAVLFVPTRRRLNELATRVVGGDRQAPGELVRTFRARLSRAVPLDELLLQLAERLRRTLALEAAEVWTRSGVGLERIASDPDRDPASAGLSDAEAAVIGRSGISGAARLTVWLPQLLAGREDAPVRVAPIVHAGELLGLIVAEARAGDDPFDEDAEAALAELAVEVGLVLRNVRLDSALQASLDELRRHAEELRSSRARVVAAGDVERRRIERDLHDGAQQYLVGIAANLGAVRDLIGTDPAAARRLLEELQTSMQEAMQAFRALAHGIYPPLLEDRGLAEALADAARQSPIATRVDARGVGRYAPGVEAAVYFCCLESIANAAKHGGDGARASVRVWEREGALLFEVRDDGVGLDPARGRRGAGLTNMHDRLAAVGGTLRVESTGGRGTTVRGAIPVESGLALGEIEEHRLDPAVDVRLPRQPELLEDRVDDLLDRPFGDEQ